MFSKSVLLLSLSTALVSCGPAPEMPEYKSSKVELLNSQNEKSFYKLPLTGKVTNQSKFWSGDYWALNRGNVNVRWNTPSQRGFDLVSPSLDEALVMSTDDLARLSPTEKFDLWLGRYDYPLKEEVYTRADRSALDWEGICNGWAPASMNHNEPTPKTFINPQGIQIPFGSSDIKALVSYYYAFIHQMDSTEQMGRRCPRGRWFNWNLDCQNDLNAGSFHVILANKIANKNQSFMVDIDRYKEVWNHPVLSYESEIMGEDEARENVPGTAKVIRLKTKVTFVDESRNNSWHPVLNTHEQTNVTRVYRYNLFLDLNNEIIGGEWRSQDRPDFLWTMGPTQQFVGLLNGLEKLLND